MQNTIIFLFLWRFFDDFIFELCACFGIQNLNTVCQNNEIALSSITVLIFEAVSLGVAIRYLI